MSERDFALHALDTGGYVVSVLEKSVCKTDLFKPHACSTLIEAFVYISKHLEKLPPVEDRIENVRNAIAAVSKQIETMEHNQGLDRLDMIRGTLRQMVESLESLEGLSYQLNQIKRNTTKPNRKKMRVNVRRS